MFNRWKKYPNKKPRHEGWHICSIRYGQNKNQAYVMDLYYCSETDTWKDNRRINVYNTYEVLGYGKTNQKKRIYFDHLCTRKDVIAFKRLPRIYK